MKGVVSCSDVFETGKLPQTEKEWIDLENIHSDFVDVDGSLVHCATFMPCEPSQPDVLTIFAGGVPRDEARRQKLPVVNKLFGYVASGLACSSGIGVTFNWPGQGQSEGDILGSSIDSRTKFLESFSQQLLDKYDVGIINYVGASMGAYCMSLTAHRLESVVEKLVFLSPAAYPAAVHDTTYDEGFGEKICKPWRVKGSPIYSAISELSVPTLIAFSEFDNPPIPQEVQDEFESLSQNTENIEYHTIKGVRHNFGRVEPAPSGNAVDNNSVREFGKKAVEFLIS